MEWLKGKKTFLVAILMVAIGGIDMLTTDMSMGGAMAWLTSDSAMTVLEGLGLGFLRAGVAK